jgi:hypothetical protein
LADEEDLDQGVEGNEEPEPTTPIDWEKEARKARKEAAKHRVELRRVKFEAKYGPDIAELVPAELPPEKWESQAEIVKARLSAGRPEEPEQQREEAPAPKVEPTPDEQRIAAASGGTSGSPAAEKMGAKAWMDLRRDNPAEADRVLLGGGVDLEGAPSPRPL